MNNSKQVTDGAILTTIFIVLLLISFIPLLSVITAFLLPIPFIIFTYKHGWKPALVMVMAAFLLGFILKNIVALPVTIIATIGGVVIGRAMHQKRSAYETWAQGTAGFAVAIVLSILFIQFTFDVNFSAEIDKQMSSLVNQFDTIAEQVELREEATEQFDLIKEQMGLVMNLFPLAIVMASLLHAFISQWITYKLMNRIEQKNYRFPPFRELTFPSAILWVYLITMLITLTQPDPEGMLFITVQNVLMLAGMLIMIQGVSFIFYFLYIKELSPALSVIGIILVIFFAPIAFPLLRILGIIDMGFKLRERLSDDKK